jgi:hypothetical protein
MGNPDEIVEVLRNRRLTKKNLNIGTLHIFSIFYKKLILGMVSAGLVDKAEILKKPFGGVPVGGMMGNPLPGMGMLGTVQLRKVEKPPEGEKKSISGPATNITINNKAADDKNQNLAHLSNMMVQGAIRKSNFNIIFFIYNFFL